MSRGKGEFSVLNLSRSRETTQWETEAPSRSLARRRRGCSDPRRRSSDSWVVASGRIFSPVPPPFARPVHIFHRLEILFARSAAKLSRFEIFMNGSDTPTTLDPAAHRKGTAATPHQRPLSPPSLFFVLRHRARFATCCQTRRRLPVPFRSGSNLLPSLLRSVLLHLLAYFLFSLRYCLWNSSNGAG